jgi:hypothetical protein
MMNVTNHARDRIKERSGLPKKAIDRNAEKALEKGLRHAECSGRLKRYFDYLYLKHNKGSNIRIYNNHVYIFTNKYLITVLPLPGEHRHTAQKLLKKRKADGDN